MKKERVDRMRVRPLVVGLLFGLVLMGLPIYGNASEWVSVSAGGSHTVAVRADGTLWAWGENSYGQLGDGTGGGGGGWEVRDRGRRLSPVRVGTATNWASVSVGYWHTVAIRTDGTLWAWGQNDHGQLGNGGGGLGDMSLNPVQIGTAANWASVSAGPIHTVAIGTDGSLWVWGVQEHGTGYEEAGEGNFRRHHYGSTPTRIGTDTNWAFVSANTGFVTAPIIVIHSFTIALRTDGSLWAWGVNFAGQLGTGGGGEGDMSLVPVRVMP